MIKKLIVKNFQSHKKTILQFHKGVNVIIGKTNSGKTAILRALYWLINNRPTGDAFRSKWGGTTIVDLNLSSGEHIKRIRNKSKNCYQLDEEVYETPGQNVPERIKGLLNMRAINFQHQFDAPFMIMNSPGERAKELNKIVRLDVMDRCLRNLNAKTRKGKAEIHAKEELIEDLQRKLINPSLLDALNKKVELLERTEEVLKKKEFQRKELKEFLLHFQAVNEEYKSSKVQLKRIQKITAKIQEAEQAMNSYAQLEKERFSLSEKIYELKNLQKLGLELQRELENCQQALLKELPSVCPICGKPISKKDKKGIIQ